MIYAKASIESESEQPQALFLVRHNGQYVWEAQYLNDHPSMTDARGDTIDAASESARRIWGDAFVLEPVTRLYFG